MQGVFGKKLRLVAGELREGIHVRSRRTDNPGRFSTALFLYLLLLVLSLSQEQPFSPDRLHLRFVNGCHTSGLEFFSPSVLRSF
jgi:hypothetical protein